MGIALYLILNLCYSVAVFTDPGSPGTTRNRGNSDRYSSLPTTELPEHSSFTVSSTGSTRYCKKCQCAKPDRAHHCSSCRRCVLKMDHHCPWLATCVGLRNYKPFVLFLMYTSLFCWVCLGVTAHWIWAEIFSDSQYLNVTMPVNVVLLAVVSGIIGLVLTGFTIWHISLAFRGMTTIESLEKTRYLSPLRKSLDRERAGRQPGGNGWPGSHGDHGIGQTLQGFGQQVLDSHANAIPGVTREEEGEERPSPTLGSYDTSRPYQNTHSHGPPEQYQHQSPAQQSLHHSYEELEIMRQRKQYEDYLDERDSQKLPHAFNLGWRRNLQHLFGEKPLFWFLPICNTTGDGWKWEASGKWLDARERIRHERSLERHEPQAQPAYGSGRFYDQPQPRNNYPTGRSESHVPRNNDRPGTGVSMKTLRPVSPHNINNASEIENESDRYSTFSADDLDLSPEDEERRALNPSAGPRN